MAFRIIFVHSAPRGNAFLMRNLNLLLLFSSSFFLQDIRKRHNSDLVTWMTNIKRDDKCTRCSNLETENGRLRKELAEVQSLNFKLQNGECNLFFIKTIC